MLEYQPCRLQTKMGYAGSQWLRENLKYEKKPRTPSVFGDAVADLLGYCWLGLYHLPQTALSKARWEDPRWIVVAIGPTDLATWDSNTLTMLVVVAHDMAIRVSVFPNGRGLKLGFGARQGRYTFDAKSPSLSTSHPALEAHVAKIREGYEVQHAQFAQEERSTP